LSGQRPELLSRSPICAWMRELDPYPELEIHPATARERKIADGDLVWIETPKARCKHKAKVTDKIHPRVVNGCFGWWFPEKPAPEHGCLEANINILLAYEPPHDPITGINKVQGVMCEVYPNQ
jgi:anaerobic selenocysteine-containing dehydrogenase